MPRVASAGIAKRNQFHTPMNHKGSPDVCMQVGGWGRSLTLQCLIKFPMMRKEKSQLCDTLNPHMYDEEGKICETVTSYWRSLAPHAADDEEHPSRLDPEFLHSNTKTAQYRATRRPRISRLDRSIAN